MLEYTRTLNDFEEAILKNDLLEIKEWIDAAIAGKINACIKRGAIQERELLKTENAASMPVQDSILAENLLRRSGYKTRAEKDAVLILETK